MYIYIYIHPNTISNPIPQTYIHPKIPIYPNTPKRTCH